MRNLTSQGYFPYDEPMANILKVKIKMPTKARVIRPHELPAYTTLPDTWTNAMGILKNKRIGGLRYQRKVRSEWEKRLKKQVRLGRARVHGN